MQVTSKAALEYIPPFPFAAMRVASAVPLLWILARAVEPGPWLFPAWSVGAFALLGFFGVLLPQGLIFVGVHLVGPSVVAILQPTIPVYVALLSAALGLERLTPLKGCGIALSVAGAVIVLDPTHLDLASAQTTGMLIMIVQTMSYAVFVVGLSRVLAAHPRPFTVFAWASAFGAAYLALAALPQLPSTAWRAVPWSAWATLAYCAIGVSFAAHGSVSWAVQHIAPTVPSLYACLQPLLVTLLAAAVYGDVLTWHDAGGMVLILGGLLVTVYAKHAAGPDGAEARPRLVAVGSRVAELVALHGAGDDAPDAYVVGHVGPAKVHEAAQGSLQQQRPVQAAVEVADDEQLLLGVGPSGESVQQR